MAKAGIRRTQRAWFAYRSAFVAVATTLGGDTNTLKSELTLRRKVSLEGLLRIDRSTIGTDGAGRVSSHEAPLFGYSALMVENIIDLAALAPRLNRFDRLIGLDLGTKTIGVAISDVERRLASPVTTIRRTRFTHDAHAVMVQATTLQAAALVVGLPLNMDGSEGPRVQATRAFIRNMATHTTLPFVLWDERLSTAAVTRSLIEQDASRAKRAAVVDRMAAAYILQGALDRLARLVQMGRPAQYPG